MKKMLTAVACATLLSGCASIIKGGGPQSITITSAPSEAAVSISNKKGEAIASGTTPYTVALKPSRGYFKGEDYLVTITKPGFVQQQIAVNSSVNGWYIGGNLLIGGLIGYLIVDPLTGAMWTLGPDKVSATLPAAAQASNGDGHALNIVLAQDVPGDVMATATPVIAK